VLRLRLGLTENGRPNIGWLSIVALLALAGCAGKVGLSQQEQVTARADAYWAAMIAADYEKAYGFLSPGFRIRLPADVYGKRFAGKTSIHEARVSKVECETEVCELVVDTKQTIHAMPPFNFDLEQDGNWKQKWIYTNENWWLLPKK
jgi:hypothetical protein